ncbi:hypothetical protein FRC05_003186, partial [Tulasnella sp. 425]
MRYTSHNRCGVEHFGDTGRGVPRPWERKVCADFPKLQTQLQLIATNLANMSVRENTTPAANPLDSANQHDEQPGASSSSKAEAKQAARGLGSEMPGTGGEVDGDLDGVPMEVDEVNSPESGAALTYGEEKDIVDGDPTLCRQWGIATERRSEKLLSTLAVIQSARSNPNLDDSNPTVERVFYFFEPICNEVKHQLLLAGDRADGGDGTTAPRTAGKDQETRKLVQDVPPTDPATTEKAKTGLQDASQQTGEQLGSLPAPVEKTLEGPQSRSRPRAKPIQCNVSLADACEMLFGGPFLVRNTASQERLQALAPKEWKEAVGVDYDVVENNFGPDDIKKLASCMIAAVQAWMDQSDVQEIPDELKV